jgi:hypothetical protein
MSRGCLCDLGGLQHQLSAVALVRQFETGQCIIIRSALFE